MAISLVGAASHNESQATDTSIAVTRNGIVAGNLIVCAVTVDDATTISNVSDGTTTVSAADVTLDWAAGTRWMALFSFPNHTGGNFTFTANFAATATFRCIDVIELQGALASSPKEGTASAQATSATPSSGNVSPSPTLDGEYIVGFALGATALTAGSGFADLVNDPTVGTSDMEGFAQSTAAAKAATWTMSSGVWGAIAVSYKPVTSMTYYLNNPVQGGGNAGLLDTLAPTASTSTTGWTVGTTGVNQYSRQTYNTEVSATGFAGTAQPSGALVNLGEDAWRLSAVTSGTFSAGTWYSSVSVIAVSSGGIQQGRGRFRLWRSANADGTGATEITQGTMVGSQVTELSTTVAQTSSASTQISALTLTNEFLFQQTAWETL